MIRHLVAIVDYGVGNLGSVKGAVARAGHRALVSRDPEVFASADLLILPGVGAFPAAMRSLERHGLIPVLQTLARQGKPLLGICLGMQLLADRSYENGETSGLGLIRGSVEPHPRGLRHIGWNRIHARNASPWLDSLDGEFFYFNHSSYFQAEEGVLAATAHNDGGIAAAVESSKIIGVQFHPEKSQAAGDRLMRRLIEHLTA